MVLIILFEVRGDLKLVGGHSYESFDVQELNIHVIQNRGRKFQVLSNEKRMQ